jgi:hypothetical protein
VAADEEPPASGVADLVSAKLGHQKRDAPARRFIKSMCEAKPQRGATGLSDL